MTYPSIVTELAAPSTPLEYRITAHAAEVGRAQIRPSGRAPWLWYVAWPTRRLFEIDAKAALASPYFPEAVGYHSGMTIGQLAQRICIAHAHHVLTAHAELADPNHPDLYRKDPH